MQLPVSLEYELGTEAHVAHIASVTGLPLRSYFWHSVLYNWQCLTGLMIGLGCAFVGGFVFLGSLILVIIVSLLVQLRRSCSMMPAHARKRRIRLDISAAGMTEHDEEVQAYMPWSSILRWKRHAGFLFIELRNHYAAIIAATDASGQPINLEEIANLLREHGVKERS